MLTLKTLDIMKKITLLGCVMLLTGILQSIIASTYYVSPTGNNTDGLSPATAWTGTTKVNSATFLAGDKVLFEGGKTFVGNISITSADGNNATNPVTFSSYGTGRATISTTGTTVDGFKAYDTQGITITNLIFQGPGNSSYVKANNGINIYSDIATQLTGFVIRNVEVKNFSAIGISFMQWGATANTGGFKRITMDSLKVHDAKEAGISIFCNENTATATSWQCYGVRVTNCEVYNIPGYATTSHKGSGIVLSQVDSVLIEKCVAYNTGTMNSACGGPGGIWLYSANNGLIQFCESHHNSSGTATGCDGLGFDLDGGVTNTTIQYCYAHDNDGAGYLLGNYSASRKWGTNTVRYCVSVNDSRTNNSSVTLFTASGTTWDGLKFYNNTVYSNPYGASSNGSNYRSQNAAFQMSNYGSSMINIECYNNILQTTGGVALMNIPNVFVTGTSPKFINNLYWTTGGAYKMTYGNSTYTSLANFRGTNREQISAVNYGLNVDPLLTNASTAAPTLFPASTETLNAYKITASSPAKDAGLDLLSNFGINVGLRDYWNNISKSGAAYDIGAHEYTASLPTEMANNSVSSGLMIFPNPSYEEFGVMFDNQDGIEVQISITDVSGKLVYETITTESLLKFGNLGLGTGVYFVTARGQNVNATGKLLIK
jgi:Secretion system C-terminal sorting domain/Right handed beta helix region